MTIPLELKNGQVVVPEGWRLVERELIPSDALVECGNTWKPTQRRFVGYKQIVFMPIRITRQPKEGQ